MRPIKLAFLLALIFLPSSHAQEARFFRIAGPVSTTITACNANGYVTWTNAPTNATFTVQTASSLVGPSNWVDYIQVPVTNSATAHRLYDPNPPSGMVLVPAGSFTMGDNLDGIDSALPLHTVYVSEFYMDKYEVTKALWDEVYNWATNHGYSFDYGDSGQGKASNHPAHSMTWHDAVKWCNARSEKEGRTAAYCTDTAQTVVYRSGQTNVDNAWVNWRSGYRLPTEAEWKAARGGLSGKRFPWSEADITHSLANYNSFGDYPYDTSPTRNYHPSFDDGIYPYTSPVGYFAPNGYGLYDIAGNVKEWCWDWIGAYSDETVTDPVGPVSGWGRELRGGGWVTDAFFCRSALRDTAFSTTRGVNFGFRSVLPLVQ